MNSESCGRYIRTIRTFFLSSDVTRWSSVFLPWILYSGRRPRPMLCCQYSWRSPENSSESRYVSDTRGRANSICIWIRADVEIFESGKKKLRLQKYPDKCGRMGPKNSFFLLFKWMMSVVQTLMPQNKIDSKSYLSLHTKVLGESQSFITVRFPSSGNDTLRSNYSASTRTCDTLSQKNKKIK